MLPKLQNLIFYTGLFASVALALAHQTSTLGQTALILLTVVIFTKPLVRLFPTIGFFKSLLVLRRQIGQVSAFVVIGHVVAQVYPGGNPLDLLSFAVASGPASFQFWGLWGFILILPLLITSNDFSVRLLKRNWFFLQKLVHPLYIFALLHYGLQKGTPTLTICLLVLVLLYFLRFLAARGIKFFIPQLSTNR